MISCIVTVIKNEHEYLDEWIKYHLNLGINHIFIFEDIDSKSHQDICNKYKDNVTLNNIRHVIIEENDKKLADKLKLTKKVNVQHVYFKCILKYLYQLPIKYDWCFVIDNDEFITLENENNKLEDVLNLYNDYDAIVLYWKCYGANGLINKPDYTNKGVIETYTKEAKGRVIKDSARAYIKTCYKLNKNGKYKYYNSHLPQEHSNWIATNYQRDMTINPIYDNIYLRHYITKSWEEYVWKKQTRGFIFGGHRHLDTFFEINPDMLNKKDELINSLKEDQ